MEKKCKYCAMMIPKEASICPHCRKQQGTSTGVKILTVIFILMGIGMCQSLTSNKGGTGGSAPSVSVGKEGILSGTSGTLTPVAITEAALDQFLKSHSANDKDGMVQMIATGLVFSVDNGTKVLVIDHGEGMFKRKIRILEGNMKGRAGYVPYEWVKPL